jgi:hypothetical protein
VAVYNRHGVRRRAAPAVANGTTGHTANYRSRTTSGARSSSHCANLRRRQPIRSPAVRLVATTATTETATA